MKLREKFEVTSIKDKADYAIALFKEWLESEGEHGLFPDCAKNMLQVLKDEEETVAGETPNE